MPSCCETLLSAISGASKGPKKVTHIPNDIFQFSLSTNIGRLASPAGPTPANLSEYGNFGVGVLANGLPLVFIDTVAHSFDSANAVTRVPADAAMQMTTFVPEHASQTGFRKARADGFWLPEWAAGISVAGVHCYYFSDHEEGERVGGRVLEFEARDGKSLLLDWAVTGRFHLGMPKGAEWEALRL
ncbi:uncharacterized protein BDZ99DRAFT_577108 [Mytilinidion resinicola]|uniref:Alpha-acetolactate decarboxylase n=1 Tax=Mytilinidion resinicola TaxID=574789 RepID=A0A6A6Y005_9PEZI|nr:uncharacterized protein BDZ99DRAFT_577108 [Mytilinidion resinicola]KAF2802141.1 hypothetical protein BDZ99DRAFT_577108 [Mytilinidion resinicola]